MINKLIVRRIKALAQLEIKRSLVVIAALATMVYSVAIKKSFRAKNAANPTLKST